MANIVNLLPVEHRGSVIGAQNLMTELSVTSTVNQSELPYLWDYLTTTAWSTGGAGVFEITIDNQAGETYNYLALGAGNWGSAGAEVTLKNGVNFNRNAGESRMQAGDSFAQAHPVGVIASVSDMTDDQPVMITFQYLTSATITIVIECSSELFISNMAVGLYLEMPKTPSVGFQPARLNSRKEAVRSITQSNAFGRVSVTLRGYEEVLPYEQIEMDWLRDNWPMVQDYEGQPIWVKWNTEFYPDEVIFGVMDRAPISYTSTLYSNFSITVRGLA